MSINNSDTEQDTSKATKARTPARVTATERRRRRDSEAAVLRAQGKSYDDISDALGYSGRSAAHKAARRALADTVQQSTAEARVLAQQRLDGLRRMLVNLVTETPRLAPRDTIAAARALLAVEEREAKLLGLDLDATPEVTSTMFDAEIERLTREIVALEAPRPPEPWEAEWTPQDASRDDQPRAEVVRSDRRGDRR